MDAFEAIYIEHFDGVRRYVFTLCRDEHLAEEIAQEAFYRALTHFDRFDGRCSVFSWLCKIAKNLYFTRQKRARRLTPLDGVETGEAPSPEDALADSDSAWEIHKALHAMPEPYKEVFTLRVLGELSFARIAELFGKSESWARVTFFRAKTMLRRDTDG